MKSKFRKMVKRVAGKAVFYLLTGICCILIGGCGADGERQMAPGPAVADGPGWLAEEVKLPLYKNVHIIETQGTTLYYEATFLNGAAYVEDIAVFGLDMSQQQTGPARPVPYTLYPGESVETITVDDRECVHILTRQFLSGSVVWNEMDHAGANVNRVYLDDYFTGSIRSKPLGMLIDREGNGWFYDNRLLVGLKPNGNLILREEMKGAVSLMCDLSDGSICILKQGESGMELMVLDPESKVSGAYRDLSPPGEINGMAEGVDGQLLFSTMRGVYAYNLKTNDWREWVNWSAAGVVPGDQGEFAALSDGRMLWMNKELQSYDLFELLLIRERKEGETIPEESGKTVLTLGAPSDYLNDSGGKTNSRVIKQAVVDFNESNDHYRIEIIEYEDGEETAGLMSGSTPDIIVLPAGVNLDLYAGRGVLEDLNPFWHRDGTDNRWDFQENIIKAFERDGRLYAFPISYSILTLCGSPDVYGGQNQWNLEEMIRYTDRYPARPLFLRERQDASSVSQPDMKSAMLEICLKANWNELMNPDNSPGGFNRALLIRALKFSAQTVREERYREFSVQIYVDGISEYAAVRRNQGVLLLESTLSNTSSDLFNTLQGFGYKKPLAYPGYPSERGNGNLISSGSALAISSRCQDKEAAWEFISILLSEEVQASTTVYELPIRKSALMKHIKVIEVGEKSLKPLAEHVEALMRVIECADKLYIREEQIEAIVMEEAEVYFRGSRTAEETADAIEKRMGDYFAALYAAG